MKPRNHHRPRVEELEQRAVPAAHLVGCHALNETVEAQFNGSASAVGNIPSGLLRGKVSLSDTVVFSDFVSTTITGTLTITTKQGKVTIQDRGTLLGLTGAFTDSGTITGGTGRFKGVTGTIFVQGTVNLMSRTVSATLTGMICGPAAHGGHQLP
jgi:hypothetical protein